MKKRLYLLLMILLMASLIPAKAEVGETITDYYSPCANGTDATVSTWHSVTQNGQPPLDPERRTFDFRCEEKQIYAPAEGWVWGTTLRFGGVILIQDEVNDACMVFLGMHEIEVEPEQAIATGDFLGRYGHAFHFTATDGSCADANWYDHHARAFERPIIFEDIGEELAVDIHRTAPYRFVSGNPGGVEE